MNMLGDSHISLEKNSLLLSTQPKQTAKNPILNSPRPILSSLPMTPIGSNMINELGLNSKEQPITPEFASRIVKNYLLPMF
jgi:hypothetical protein